MSPEFKILRRRGGFFYRLKTGEESLTFKTADLAKKAAENWINNWLPILTAEKEGKQ